MEQTRGVPHYIGSCGRKVAFPEKMNDSIYDVGTIS